MKEITHIFINKIILRCLFIFSVTFNIYPAIALEWYENGTLHTATFQQWKTATQSNKLATCAKILINTAQKGYLLTASKDKLLDTNNTELLKTLAEILVITTDAYINNSNHLDDTASDAIVLGMLVLQWINPKHVEILRNIAHTIPEHPQSSKPSTKNNAVKVQPQRKLLNKKTGRAWIKRNISIGGYLPLDKLSSYIGHFEKVTDNHYKTFSLEKYYFYRVDITFLVIQPSNKLIGYVTGKTQ